MPRRAIGQEELLPPSEPAGSRGGNLDGLARTLNWEPISAQPDDIYTGRKGEPAWPPMALFKALLLSICYDLSDVRLAEMLDDRSSFRRFCGFSRYEPTPERTAFVRFRRALVDRGLDRVLFETITAQLNAKAIAVKTGALVDATIIASASEHDEDAKWVKHKGRKVKPNSSNRQADGETRQHAE